MQNLAEWSGTASNPSLYDALRLMLSVSFVFITVLLLFAFYKTVKGLAEAIKNGIADGIAVLKALLTILVYEVFDMEAIRARFKQRSTTQKPGSQTDEPNEKTDDVEMGRPSESSHEHVE